MRKSPQQAGPSLKSSVTTIRRYADSFDGLTIRKVRARLSAGKITMTVWKQGKQLVAKFPKHEVRVFFFKNAAVTTSVQIISR
jgi:hypothetical protein